MARGQCMAKDGPVNDIPEVQQNFNRFWETSFVGEKSYPPPTGIEHGLRRGRVAQISGYLVDRLI